MVPGGTLIYDSSWPRQFERDDIDVIGIPIAKLVAKTFHDARQRQLFKNIAYLGALSLLLNIDVEVVTGLRLQTPVIVLSDLDIGMNDWVVGPLQWEKDREHDRGKLLDAEALESITDFARYRDVDGDGIGYRTAPGTHPDRGAFFTRGTSHNEYGGYSENGEGHAKTLDRLRLKFETGAGMVPKPVIRTLSAKSRLGVINIGSTDLAIREALSRFAGEGHGLNHMRIRAFPFTEEVIEFSENHDFIFVIEQNRDAQLRTLLIAETDIPGDKLVPVLNYDGLPLTATGICDAIRAVLNSNPQVEEAVAAPLTVA